MKDCETYAKLDKLSETSSELCHDAFLLMGQSMADFAWWSEKGQQDASYLEDAERRILIAQNYGKKVLANIREMRAMQMALRKEEECANAAT